MLFWLAGKRKRHSHLVSLRQTLFDVFDADGDGVISRAETSFGFMKFHLCSEPGDPLSELFGPVVQE